MELNLNINTKKNLLAFSAGVDSTALFSLLQDCNIPFDIVMVDYGLREQSKKEILYAKNLAKEFQKKIYIENFPKHCKFSQKIGRDFRYNFFVKICKKFDYESLITAHQLNDRFEWFMMQLSKGAGISQLMSMQKSYKKDGLYHLKPLLDITKDELLNYLTQNKIKYFIDESNKNRKYKRNDMRYNFTDNFLKLYENGIKNSFEYLELEANLWIGFETTIKRYKQLVVIKYKYINKKQIIWLIDQELKNRGLMMTAKTKKYLETQSQAVVSHRFVVSYDENRLWVAPYSKTTIPKKNKEVYRLQRYPKLIRPYLYDICFKI
ncbi:MAG: tRNA lysidine(34) synthetase TilS [Epsilonproteobacteria bacterium]|nr:MAG: tRNA lysidine(34) synthetase TilS [Campylobacterota bacterium]